MFGCSLPAIEFSLFLRGKLLMQRAFGLRPGRVTCACVQTKQAVVRDRVARLQLSSTQEGCHRALEILARFQQRTEFDVCLRYPRSQTNCTPDLFDIRCCAAQGEVRNCAV